jgi:hypothetical protein
MGPQLHLVFAIWKYFGWPRRTARALGPFLFGLIFIWTSEHVHLNEKRSRQLKEPAGAVIPMRQVLLGQHQTRLAAGRSCAQ